MLNRHVQSHNEGLTFASRRDRFCRELVAGHSAAEAARRAGYSANGARQAAHRLLTKVDVQARVRALRARAASRVPITFERHVEQLETLREDARRQGQLAVALRAEELLGRLMGFYVNKAEAVTVTTDLAGMTLPDLRALARQLIPILEAIADGQ